jgi:hypothetical protein
MSSAISLLWKTFRAIAITVPGIPIAFPMITIN